MHFSAPAINTLQTQDLSWTMAPITRNTYTNPAFFVHQSQKLQALLTKVVQESASATSPEAAIDLLQLTEILTALLEEAQLYSILSPNDLRRRQSEVQAFMSKFETIESAVGDWNLRVAPDVPTTSRKRGRASTSENEASKSSRARSNEQRDHALNAAPVFEGPFSEMIPLDAYEPREVEWRNEPYYD